MKNISQHETITIFLNAILFYFPFEVQRSTANMPMVWSFLEKKKQIFELLLFETFIIVLSG